MHSLRVFCKVEVDHVSLFERTEGLEATQFSQVTSVMRVKYLDEEVACLKEENDSLKASLQQQH